MTLKKEISFAAAILALLGSAGYLLRFISEYTNYIIRIKVLDSFLYGLIPCLLIALYAVSMLRAKTAKQAILPGVMACCVTVFSLIVVIAQGNLSDEELDYAGFGILILGVIFALLYLLTLAGILKTAIPARIITTVSAAVYALMLAVTVYMYTTSGDPISSYYGALGSVSGLTLFYVSVTVSTYSIRFLRKTAAPVAPFSENEEPFQMVEETRI